MPAEVPVGFMMIYDEDIKAYISVNYVFFYQIAGKSLLYPINYEKLSLSLTTFLF
jgi:hypothetical protein